MAVTVKVAVAPATTLWLCGSEEIDGAAAGVAVLPLPLQAIKVTEYAIKADAHTARLIPNNFSISTFGFE